MEKPYGLVSAYNRAIKQHGPKLPADTSIKLPLVVLRVWGTRRVDRRTRETHNGWIEYICNLGGAGPSVWDFLLVEGIPTDAYLLLKDDSNTEVDPETGIGVFPVRRIHWKEVDFSLFRGEPLNPTPSGEGLSRAVE